MTPVNGMIFFIPLGDIRQLSKVSVSGATSEMRRKWNSEWARRRVQVCGNSWITCFPTMFSRFRFWYIRYHFQEPKSSHWQLPVGEPQLLNREFSVYSGGVDRADRFLLEYPKACRLHQLLGIQVSPRFSRRIRRSIVEIGKRHIIDDSGF